jgi:hypothetical protein
LFVFILFLVCPILPISLDCLSSSCVLCVLYCRCLWIVCLRPVSCVSNAADVSGLFVFVLCLVCPILAMSLDCLSSSCVLYVQCFRCLWIVCLRPVSCVSNVSSRDINRIRHTRHRTKTNNPEILAALDTQDIGRRQTIQRHWQY